MEWFRGLELGPGVDLLTPCDYAILEEHLQVYHVYHNPIVSLPLLVPYSCQTPTPHPASRIRTITRVARVTFLIWREGRSDWWR
jgi:hypothetical protein